VENLASYVDNKGKIWRELIVRAYLLERMTQIASTGPSTGPVGRDVDLSEWEEVSFDLRDGGDAYEVLLAHQLLKD
jgi:hypothetical protein